MRVDAPVFDARNKALSKSPRYVAAILYDVDSIYITSHDDITNVPGTVLNGLLAEPVVSSQRINPDEASAEIGSISFSIVDIGSDFTDEIRERLDDGDGPRRRTVKFWSGWEGLDFADFQLIATQKLDGGIEYHNGRYVVECLDIQRDQRSKIFEPKTTTLSATIAADATTIGVHSTSGFSRVWHGASYTDAPSSQVGYIKIKNEIIRYTGISGNDFTGCTRGVFGTTAAAYTVDGSTAADRRERVEEYIYLELPAPKLALALLTGTLWNDGYTLPSHWHMGIDADDWVTESDFTGIGDTLWKQSDDSGFILRFEGLKATDGKKFLEKEVYLPLGLYSPVYADGSLGLKRAQRILADAPHTVQLDETNSVSVGALKHELDKLHNIFSVEWGWNGERFVFVTTFADVDSYTTHGRSPVYSLKFKGIHPGRHTDGVIFTLLDFIRDRYAAPPETLTVELLGKMDVIEVGDIVRVKYAHVRDFAGAGTSIDRAFEVQRVSVNHRTKRVTLNLFGSTANPSVNAPTSASTSLPDAYYTSEGTALSAAPGITISSNVLTAATQTLVGNADLTNTAAIYYHDGDLTINSGVTLNTQHNVQLRIKGFFNCNGVINGVGQGKAGASASTNQFGTPNKGTAGYVGNTRGRDGLLARELVRLAGVPLTIQYENYEAPLTEGQFVTAPSLALRISGNSLLGVPTDLRGTSGGEGGTIWSHWSGTNTQQFAAGAGGNSGAGLMIVCRGMAFGANGQINLSGANASSTTLQTFHVRQIYPGAGAAGGPGTLYVLIDGANLSLPSTGGKFVAQVGTVPSQGTAIEDAVVPEGSPTTPVAGLDRRLTGIDISGSAVRVQRIPASETANPMADSKPPPPTSISASGSELNILVTLTLPPFEQFDTVQIYAATSNDRSGATLVYEGRSNTFRHQLAASTTRYYWSRTADDVNGKRVYSDWLPSSSTGGATSTSTAGGTGPAGDSLYVEYSVNGTSGWHTPPFVAGDIYMRQQLGTGGWGPAIRIVGEQGTTGANGSIGNYIDVRFKREATQPSTPTGNTPAGWSDAPPAHDGNPLWITRGEKTGAGTLVGAWSTPAAMALDGEDGAQGIPGPQGPGLFTWTGASGATTAPSSIVKTGGAGWNAGAYSLQSYTGGCYMSCRAGEIDQNKAIGLNTDASTDYNLSSIDFAFYASTSATLYCYGNGTLLHTVAGTYTTNTALAIVHDDDTVKFLVDGATVHSVTGQAGKRFFLDVALDAAGSSFVDVMFGPSGSKGSTGAAAKVLSLTSTAQAFTYSSAGAPSPGGQSITFTSNRQNIAANTTWTATPSVTLTGSGDTRALAVADFGANTAVTVRAAAEGLFDEITIVRLQDGATGSSGANGVSPIVGLLSNEAATVAADPNGVVADLTPTTGMFRVFEGVTERTTTTTFSVQSQTGCTAQINTADNTPIAGQPRGFYRLTAISVDNAQAVLRGVYGSVTVDKTFSVTRSRQGQPGNGANLLNLAQWVIGSTSTQGNFSANQSVSTENAIVLAGSSGSIPLGPYGTSEPLWECRPSGDGSADGGWANSGDLQGKADPKKSYRSRVWVYVNQISGYYYHGCDLTNTNNLDGSQNTNPYFLYSVGLPASGRWYLSVGIIHGQDYTGPQSGISGLYDPITGKRVVSGIDYKMRSGATYQMHRVYHYYDGSSATRQYMAQPAFEEINGNEPSLASVLASKAPVMWVARGSCEAEQDTFRKTWAGIHSWDSDVYSHQGYDRCHVIFKAGQTNAHLMIGLNRSPLTDQSYTSIDYAWYPSNDGVVYIYESGNWIGNFGAYTTDTLLEIRYNGTTVEYYKDGVYQRGVTDPGRIFHLDASFYTLGAFATGIVFGVGERPHRTSTGDIAPHAVTDNYIGEDPSTTYYPPTTTDRIHPLYLYISPPFMCDAVITVSYEAYWVRGDPDLISGGNLIFTISSAYGGFPDVVSPQMSVNQDVWTSNTFSMTYTNMFLPRYLFFWVVNDIDHLYVKNVRISVTLYKR